jgi:hypothetical protein
MCNRNPDAFQGAIRFQNQTMSIQQVITINHIGKEAMYYLSDRIQAIPGVIDVVPTRNVEQTGRSFVIVNKDNVERVLETLLKKFNQCYADVVPDDARPKSDQYTGLPPEIGTARSEGFSEGDNLWMTNSTRSYMSFSVISTQTGKSNDKQYLDQTRWETPTGASTITNNVHKATQPTENQTFASYAAAAGAVSSDQMSGITDSELLPRDLRHEELNLKIASLEAIMRALCAQVQTLTSQTQVNVEILQTPRNPSQQQEKRQDIKSTRRRARRSDDQTANLVAEEGSQKSAPPMKIVAQRGTITPTPQIMSRSAHQERRNLSRDNPILAQQPNNNTRIHVLPENVMSAGRSIQLTVTQRLEIAQTKWRKVLNPNATPAALAVNRFTQLNTQICEK